MTIPEICDNLAILLQAQITAVTTGEVVTVDVDFSDALTERWLTDSVQLVFETLSRNNSRENELVGSLEANAFLAAFQKAYQNQQRTRCTRWAALFSAKNRQLAADGPLAAQLRHVGVKVDDEWLTKVLWSQ